MISINGKEYKELRCKECQHFLIYQSISAGIIFIQCVHCGFANEWTFKFMKTKENISEIEKFYAIEGSQGSEEIPQT